MAASSLDPNLALGTFAVRKDVGRYRFIGDRQLPDWDDFNCHGSRAHSDEPDVAVGSTP